MGRPRRFDRPNAVHHVTLRGQGHSALFENEQDVARYTSLLSLVVKDGALRILAFSFLATHMHLMLESPLGELSRAMHRVNSLYARYYNRTRVRDGHAYKARFFSRQVEDDIYRAGGVGYIDFNAVLAGMVKSPGEYAHGSARYYLGEIGPRWLSRDDIEALVCRMTGSQRYDPAVYPRLWEMTRATGMYDIVALALSRAHAAVAPLRVLLRAGPEYVQRWLMENLRREEGRTRPCLVLARDQLLRHLPAVDLSEGYLQAHAMRAGLLRLASGLTTTEVAAALKISQSSATRAAKLHDERMLIDAHYAGETAAHLSRAIQAVYGSFARE